MVLSILLSLMLVQGSAALIADDLRAGMQLVYSSNGQAQPPWSIDSVVTGLVLEQRTGCSRILIRRRPKPAPAEETRYCIAGDTLLTWSARDTVWRPQRPVGPGMQMAFLRATGDTVRYETRGMAEEVISGRRIRVLETTVTTVDSLGRPKRRLRERYAPGLATATGGQFEVPDASAPGGWRTEQTFELTEIRNGIM